jgi:hypothetical protein
MSLNAGRKWKYGIVAVIVCGLLAAAYTPARQFHRFFMTPCAADGPARETELEIDVPPVDVPRLYAELREAAGTLPIEQIASASHADSKWPIYLIGNAAPPNVATLVIAGVHGNEVSGSLAAREVLRMMREPNSGNTPLLLVAPANPVGLAAGSRYNSQGCDINRDFSAFRTVEARAIRSAIDRVRPRLVVALHEGPQDGVFVIGTQITPQALLERVIASLSEQKIPLASENNLGLGLSTPGLMSERSVITRAKSWLGIYSVGEYTSPLGIPLVTIEVPWGWADMNERIAAQTIAVQAAASYVR